MHYDFLLLHGVEDEPGSMYACTPPIQVLGDTTRILFKKVRDFRASDDICLIPEVQVTTMTPNDAYPIVARNYAQEPHEFYVLRSTDCIEVVITRPVGAAVEIRPLTLGIVKRDLLFRSQPELESLVGEYATKIRVIV